MSESRSGLDDREVVAHGPNDAGRWHDLLEHLLAVSERAAGFAEVIGASEAARLIGFWHDIGKLNPAWQKYLRDRVAGKRVKGPEHAIVALQLFLDAFSDKRYQILAYLMDCHHRGLQDVREDFGQRKYRAAEHPWIRDVAQAAREVFEGYVPLQAPTLPPVLDMMRPENEGSLALTWRLLHACLVDADCLDTEAHDQAPKKRGLRRDVGRFAASTKRGSGGFAASTKRGSGGFAASTKRGSGGFAASTKRASGWLDRLAVSAACKQHNKHFVLPQQRRLLNSVCCMNIVSRSTKMRWRRQSLHRAFFR